MAVQSTHSAIDFIMQYPELAKEWHSASNYLCQLSIENEHELKKLIEKAERKGIKFVVFREPDLDNQITSVCFEPSNETRRLTSSLPLMLKEYSRQEVVKEAA